MNSLLSQTIDLDNLEIILVDDVSTDNTVNKLRWYEEHYPDNIMLILCEQNGRQGTARNIGLQYASGDYVCFVDSDDWIRKDTYQILTSIIEESDCDIVQFEYIGKTAYCEDEPLSNTTYQTYDVSTTEAKRCMLIDGNIYNESCTRKIYRRDIINISGARYAEGVSYEEPLFTYPIKFFTNKICVLNQPLYYYRYNDKGTTASYMQNPSKILEHLSVQLDVYNFMKSTDYYTVFKNEIDLYFIHSYFCEQFYFLKYRGFTLPLALFKYSSKMLEHALPEWRDNKYLSDSSMKEERKILALVDELKCLNDNAAQAKIIETQNMLTE